MAEVPPAAGRSRWVLVGLSLVAALALVFAVGSPAVAHWWKVGDVLTIGPAGTSACFGGDACERHGLEWLGGPATFRKAALGTTAGGLIAGAALVALAGALAARRKGTLAAGVVVTASLTAAVAGSVFVATFPGVAGALGDGKSASLAIGAIVYALGVVLGLAAALVVLRRRA